MRNALNTLDVKGCPIISIEGLKITHKTLYLDISSTEIRSLSGLKKNKIAKLIANSTKISNLKGFAALEGCYSISLLSTPVSKHKNFVLSLYILLGDQLTSINGKTIPNSIKQRAKKYPPIAKKLINEGWMAVYPCPSYDELENLRQQYVVEHKEEVLPDIFSVPEEDDSQDLHVFDIDKRLEKARKEQLENFEMLINAFSNITTSLNPLTDGFEEKKSKGEKKDFSTKVQQIMDFYGYNIDPMNKSASILRNIENLLSVSCHRMEDFPEIYGDTYMTDQSKNGVSELENSVIKNRQSIHGIEAEVTSLDIGLENKDVTLTPIKNNKEMKAVRKGAKDHVIHDDHKISEINDITDDYIISEIKGAGSPKDERTMEAIENVSELIDKSSPVPKVIFKGVVPVPDLDNTESRNIIAETDASSDIFDKPPSILENKSYAKDIYKKSTAQIIKAETKNNEESTLKLECVEEEEDTLPVVIVDDNEEDTLPVHEEKIEETSHEERETISLERGTITGGGTIINTSNAGSYKDGTLLSVSADEYDDDELGFILDDEDESVGNEEKTVNDHAKLILPAESGHEKLPVKSIYNADKNIKGTLERESSINNAQSDQSYQRNEKSTDISNEQLTAISSDMSTALSNEQSTAILKEMSTILSGDQGDSDDELGFNFSEDDDE